MSLYDRDACETIYEFSRPHMSEDNAARVRRDLDQYEPECALSLICAILSQNNVPVPRTVFELIDRVGRYVGLREDMIASLRVEDE